MCISYVYLAQILIQVDLCAGLRPIVYLRVCFVVLNTLPLGQSVAEGDLRLVGSTANGQGAVEIYSRLGWTSICPDEEWTDSDADVVCQRLGYDSGRSEA